MFFSHRQLTSLGGGSPEGHSPCRCVLSVSGFARLALSVSVALAWFPPGLPLCSSVPPVGCWSFVVGGWGGSLLVPGGCTARLRWLLRLCRWRCLPCRGPGPALAFLLVALLSLSFLSLLFSSLPTRAVAAVRVGVAADQTPITSCRQSPSETPGVSVTQRPRQCRHPAQARDRPEADPILPAQAQATFHGAVPRDRSAGSALASAPRAVKRPPKGSAARTARFDGTQNPTGGNVRMAAVRGRPRQPTVRLQHGPGSPGLTRAGRLSDSRVTHNSREKTGPPGPRRTRRCALATSPDRLLALAR